MTPRARHATAARNAGVAHVAGLKERLLADSMEMLRHAALRTMEDDSDKPASVIADDYAEAITGQDC